LTEIKSFGIIWFVEKTKNMEVRAKLAMPENTIIQVTVAMPLHEWRDFKKKVGDMSTDYPFWKMIGAINKAMILATDAYDVEVKD
jgi:hypothetical protein